MNLSIMIGGSAGQGVNTAETMLQLILTKKGYYWHSYKDYMSRVRGGYNFSVITISDQPVYCHENSHDLVLALTPEALEHGQTLLKESGLLILDEKLKSTVNTLATAASIDFSHIIKESQNPNGLSVLAVGVVCSVLGFSLSDLELMSSKKWSQEVRLKNLATAELAFSSIKQHFVLPESANHKTMTLSGNHAVALGAVAAGIHFYAAYPMAPSTSVMTQLLQYQQNHQIVMEQVEDEIAAVNAVIGAFSNGVRSMTSTSGGGFALMTEAVGLSAVSEVPLVVLDVQRPGPATGMATRTEQSDLNQMLGASQGEFPRFILSFNNVADCFYQTFRAFNLAEQFRVPVLLLSDQYLADAVSTIPKIDVTQLKITRNIDYNPDLNYKHYDQDHLKPRAIPGLSPVCVMNDSHEHNTLGQVDESGENRIAMNVRRLSKLADMSAAVKEPEIIGVKNPKTVCLAWGSVTEVLRTAITELIAAGESVAGLLFSDLYPLPQQRLTELYGPDTKFITVEGNSEAQLAQLIARETGIFIEESILKFDGRQMTPQYIIEAYSEVVSNEE